MVERRPGPSGGRVAGRAGGRESGRDVIRVVGPRIVGFVTAIAVRRRSREDVVDVACGAGQRGVCTGERVAGVFQMIVLCVVPTVHRVAGFTRSGESGAYMIENRSLKILLMA